MPDLPVMLHVEDRRCLVVGGGSVAVRRAGALLACGAQVAVVAPQMDQALADMAIERHLRTFEPDDLDDVLLVVIATDDVEVNEQITKVARRRGILVNRADDPAQGDFVVPAHHHDGPVTLAVHSGGVSATAAAAMRDELAASLDDDWPRLLLLVEPYRKQIQTTLPPGPARQARLRKLGDPAMLQRLKTEGEAAVVVACKVLLSVD